MIWIRLLAFLVIHSKLFSFPFNSTYMHIFSQFAISWNPHIPYLANSTTTMLSKSNFVLKGYNQHLCEFFFFTLQQGKGWSVRPLLFEIFKEKLLILAIDRNSLNSQILHLFVSILYCVMLVFWQWGINIVFLLIFGKVHNNYKFMTQSRLKGYI